MSVCSLKSNLINIENVFVDSGFEFAACIKSSTLYIYKQTVHNLLFRNYKFNLYFFESLIRLRLFFQNYEGIICCDVS